MPKALIADLILAVHLCVVIFIVLGEILVLIGWWRKWQWARNPWLRWLHLGAIGLVILFGFVLGYCPLTEWEYEIREAVGQSPEQGSFVGRVLHRVLFLDLPDWVFMPMYVAFALLVAATMWFYPPKRKQK
ncbi:DUF2784 domain-containing protein [bacterium]|nr:DUF2784 domain-containing protein [bacterium]